MQPSDLIPAAHQNNAIEYQPEEADLPDMVLVNPGGRVIEVPGELGQELLLQMGYRRATEAEAKQIDDYKKRTHPEILKRAEVKRVRAQRQAVDELERELAGETDSPDANEEANDEATNAPEPPKPRSRK